MTCPSDEYLIALAQGSLSFDEAKDLNFHLSAGCQACQSRFRQIQQTLSVTWTEGSGESIIQALNPFQSESRQRGQSSRQIIPAVLVFDSGSQGRLLGFRGARSASRHLLYRAGPYDIDLSMDYVESARLIDIIGQAMPLRMDLDVVANRDVELLKESTRVFATSTNEFGEFILDSVGEGVYDLKLKLEAEDINILGLRALVEEPVKM